MYYLLSGSQKKKKIERARLQEMLLTVTFKNIKNPSSLSNLHCQSEKQNGTAHLIVKCETMEMEKKIRQCKNKSSSSNEE